MAAGDTQITIAGNLVDDPELRFTPAGQPVARFRVASTPRFRDNSTGEWKDGDSLFLTCNVWRQAAAVAAVSPTRGRPTARVRAGATPTNGPSNQIQAITTDNRASPPQAGL